MNDDFGRWLKIHDIPTVDAVLEEKLTALGFSFDDEGYWWICLSSLGRKNMGLKAAEAILRRASVEGTVVDSGNHEARIHELEYAMTWADLRLGQLEKQHPEWSVASSKVLVEQDLEVHESLRGPVLVGQIRGRVFVAKPEERVRQRVIQHLIVYLGYPAECIHVEEHVADSRERADIVIHSPGDRENVLAVLECKAPTVPLNDLVLEQAKRYANPLGAQCLALTDGDVIEAFVKKGKCWEPVAGLPAAEHLFGGYAPVALKRAVLHIPRVETFDQVGACPELLEVRDPWYRPSDIGGLASFLPNLAGLIASQIKIDAGASYAGWCLFEDSGLVGTSYGNGKYGSHAYNGRYRSLIIEQEATGTRYFLQFRTWHAIDRTYLVLGLQNADSGKRSHLTQIDLERYLAFEDGVATLTHSGQVNLGEGGGLKWSEVRKEVRRRAPDLSDGDTITLGTMPTETLLGWGDVWPVVVNCFRFGLIAEDLRNQRRAGRDSGP
jgi:hypothetical protein